MFSCPQDWEWGPISACRSFDFTIHFENAALSSTDTIFLVFATLRIFYLRRQPKRDDKTWRWSNVASLVCVLFSTAVNSWYGSQPQKDGSSVTASALILQLISLIVLLVLASCEFHHVSPSSSSFVALYALTKCLLTAIACRTLQYSGALATSFAFVSVSYAILFRSEMVSRRAKIGLPYTWLLPLLWKGRHKALHTEDFGPIPTQLSAEDTYSKLYAALMTTNKTNDWYLLIASLKAFSPSFLAPVLPRLCLLAATFAQPLLVSRMLRFISDSNEPSTNGWNIVAGYALAYITIAISTSIYWEKAFDSIVEYRGALVGAIYHKTLVLSSTSGRTLGSGVASTYMSVDVERICTLGEMIHEFWQAALAVIISIVLLYREVSWPAFFPIIIIIGMMSVSAVLSRLVTRAQSRWLSATDQRVKFMTSIIHNFLPIKWSSYEKVLAERAALLRENETRGAAKYMMYFAFSVSISNVASSGCILAVLATYSVILKGSMDPAKLFTIVSVLNLISNPLVFLGQTMPYLAVAWASLLRIQAYLLLDEATGGLIELDGEADTNNVDKIILNSASFSWSSSDESPFLKSISLQLDKPQLHLVVGPVASGKSMLLVSILGETICTSGNYSSPCFRVAYAQQDKFIIPGSIRENITFGLPFKSDWYERVIEACALKTDLDRLALGNGTLLNEKGNQLSGGQKQRVALARAVYANATWTFLDDPLSALDAHTEAHVFRSLFGPNGLLCGKAVVLVTHNLKYISEADTIIILEGGKIQHQGSLNDIQAQGYIFDGVATGDDEKTALASDDTDNSSAEYIKEENAAEPPIAASSLGFAPYRFVAQMIGFTRAAVVLILPLLVAFTSLSLQYYLRELSASRGENIGAWMGGYGALSLLFLVVLAFSSYTYNYAISVHGGKHIHAAELRGLLGAAPQVIANIPTGRLVNRFAQDINMSDMAFPMSLWGTTIVFFIVVGQTTFVMIPVPWLTLSLIPLSILYYFNLVLYLGTSKQLQHLEASSKSPIYTLFSTTISGIVTIRALRAQGYFLSKNDEYLNSSQIPFYFRYGGIRFMRTLLAVISSILAVGLSALSIRLRNVVDPSALGLALVALTTLPQFLNGFMMALSGVENASVSLSRIHEIANLPMEPEQLADVPFVELPSGTSWIKEGSIAYENVELRYKKELDPVVKSVSFKISPGQKVGICGRSGSGKSTLIMALFRSLDAVGVSGKISIDNVDITTLRLEVLRSSLGLVAQDPFIWNAPLRHNIDPRGEHEDKDLWAMLKRMGLDAAAAALPEQLDTVLNDEASFSKGQRQLLCLVRVLLRKSKIVILDEASSSLDLDTDEKMRQIVHSDLADCTVIAVAHRLATIMDYDLILVMDGGVLVESGAPRELLRKSGSMFGKLAERQGVKV